MLRSAEAMLGASGGAVTGAPIGRFIDYPASGIIFGAILGVIIAIVATRFGKDD